MLSCYCPAGLTASLQQVAHQHPWSLQGKKQEEASQICTMTNSLPLMLPQQLNFGGEGMPPCAQLCASRQDCFISNMRPHTDFKTPNSFQKMSRFCAFSRAIQDVSNPCCVLSSSCLHLPKKKKVWEKEQKKNRRGKDRRKNIFVLAAGKNPNDFTSLTEKQFSQLFCYRKGRHFILLERTSWFPDNVAGLH